MSSKKSLIFLLNLIITKYFDSKCVLQFSSQDFLHLDNTTNMFVSSDKTFNTLDVNYYDQCKEFFIYKSHNPRKTFENYERFIRMHSRNSFTDRKYIFYINANETSKFEELFKSAALKFVTNLLVITENNLESELFNLYTHKYIGTNDNNKAMLLDTWYKSNSSFTLGNDLFPDKIENQHGRVITASSILFLPQTHIEHSILKIYAKMHNATLNIDMSKKHLGTLYCNWTGTGMFKMFAEDRTDLIAYGLFRHRRLMFGDYAHILSMSRPTCLVPKPTKRDRWMFIHLFRLETWIITICVYLVLFFANILFNVLEKRKRTKKRMHYLILLRTAFAQSTNFTKLNHSKAIVSSILIGIILIHTFFASKLAVKLMKPSYEHSIETIQQLADSNLKWYSEYDGVSEFYKLETAEPYKTLYKNFRHISADKIDTIPDKYFAYIVDISKQRFYSIEPYFTIDRLKKYKLMRETMMYEYTTVFFRRNSVLLPSFDKLVGTLFSHGLIKFWEFEAIHHANDTKRQLYMKIQTEDDGHFTQLNFQEIRGVFLTWFCGMCVSFVLFLFEFFRRKFKFCNVFQVRKHYTVKRVV